MQVLDYSKRILAIAETLNRWMGSIAALDRAQRLKVARFAEAIADTLGRAAQALARLTTVPGDQAARRRLVREFGRITGYLETIVDVLQHHLDGRKLAGVKRRLEQLGPRRVGGDLEAPASDTRVDRLLAAEGYFRALADSLRT